MKGNIDKLIFVLALASFFFTGCTPDNREWLYTNNHNVPENRLVYIIDEGTNHSLSLYWTIDIIPIVKEGRITSVEFGGVGYANHFYTKDNHYAYAYNEENEQWDISVSSILMIYQENENISYFWDNGYGYDWNLNCYYKRVTADISVPVDFEEAKALSSDYW